MHKVVQGRTDWTLFVAIGVFTIALGCTPNGEDEYSLALKEVALGNDAVALKMLDRLLDSQPQNSAALHTRAELRLAGGDYKGALEDFNKLQTQGHLPARAQHQKAIALQYLYRHREALVELNQLAKESPSNCAYRVDLVRSLIIMGEYERAETTLADNDMQTEPEYFLLLGAVKSNNGDLRGAEDALTRAIDQDPDSAQAYYQRSMVRKSLGDTLLAEEDSQMARALDLSRGGNVELRDLKEFRGEIAASKNVMSSQK